MGNSQDDKTFFEVNQNVVFVNFISYQIIMVSCGLYMFWLYLCPCDFSQKLFCKQLKKACSRLGSCQIVWTTGHNWMVVNSVEGVQSNGKWHNNEIYIDCYQYFDDHDHTTNTTPYMAVNSRRLSELEFQVLFTNIYIF